MATIKKAQKGAKIADSTAWKNRTFDSLTNQGLEGYRNSLSKTLTKDSYAPVVRQKIDMIGRELEKRSNKKIKELKCGGKVKKGKKGK